MPSSVPASILTAPALVWEFIDKLYIGRTRRKKKSAEQAARKRFEEHFVQSVDPNDTHSSPLLEAKLKEMVVMGFADPANIFKGWITVQTPGDGAQPLNKFCGGVPQIFEVRGRIKRRRNEPNFLFELRLAVMEQRAMDMYKDRLLNAVSVASLQDSFHNSIAALQGTIASGFKAAQKRTIESYEDGLAQLAPKMIAGVLDLGREEEAKAAAGTK